MTLFSKKNNPPVRSPHTATSDDSSTFRRSRTLTGSASEHIKSAGENRAQIKSPRLKEHELRSHRKKLGSYFLASVGVIIGLSLLLNQFLGNISAQVASAQPINGSPDTSSYLSALDEYFWENPTQRFRFALNKSTLESFLSSRVPEIETVDFEQTGLVSATAHIHLRVPVVTWQLNDKRYYVDGTGRAFTRNMYAEPSVVVKDDSGLTNNASGAIISNRFLESMGRVIALCNQSEIVITGATLPRNTTREIDFTVEGREYFIKAQLGRDAASQATDIVSAVKYLDSKSIIPKYVDVRISGRAAYL